MSIRWAHAQHIEAAGIIAIPAVLYFGPLASSGSASRAGLLVAQIHDEACAADEELVAVHELLFAADADEDAGA